MLRGGRAGQVTLFIILGLLLLFITTLLFYAQLSDLFRQRFTPYAEDVPLEVLPAKQYVTSCLEQTIKRGIAQLAKQGGVLNGSSFLSVPAAPTEGTALSVAPGWIVPYWWYLSSPNMCSTCEFQQFTPPSPEEQLAAYIAENIHYCTPVGAYAEKSPEVTVSIQDVVHVNVLYPLTITIDGRSHYLSRFYGRGDVNLPALYTAAQAITDEEMHQRFLEIQAMELVTAYSGLDRKKLPPVSETVFTAKPLFWLSSDVKAMLENVLSSYIHLLRAQGARNVLHKQVKVPYQAVLSRFYDSFIIPMTKAMPYQTHFQYFPTWPVFLALNDKGGVVMPEQASPQVLPIPLVVQRYSTVYDFSFPTLVELYDEGAFGGDGLSFFFALEGNVRANGPMNVSAQPEGGTFDEGMLCDIAQRNTRNTTITVQDMSGEPIPDAVVTFSVGESCSLGVTDERGVLNVPFPVGVGLVSVMVPDAVSVAIPLTIRLDEETHETITMARAKKVHLSVRTRQLVRDPIWRVAGEGTLTQSESVLIFFDRHQEDGEGPFQQVAQFGDEQDVMLAPGHYDVRVIRMQAVNVTLLPKQQCLETGGGFLGLQKEQSCFTIPEEPLTLEAPPLMIETKLTLTPEETQARKPITLYAPAIAYDKLQSPSYDDIFVDLSGVFPS
ncbi:hypothetical protein HY639_00295 [Candidatus Woesearchaeota archaeon]|nr:hypothetical protein [Candidatus Woesearchaeota archaeon]